MGKVAAVNTCENPFVRGWFVWSESLLSQSTQTVGTARRRLLMRRSIYARYGVHTWGWSRWSARKTGSPPLYSPSHRSEEIEQGQNGGIDLEAPATPFWPFWDRCVRRGTLPFVVGWRFALVALVLSGRLAGRHHLTESSRGKRKKRKRKKA